MQMDKQIKKIKLKNQQVHQNKYYKKIFKKY